MIQHQSSRSLHLALVYIQDGNIAVVWVLHILCDVHSGHQVLLRRVLYHPQLRKKYIALNYLHYY